MANLDLQLKEILLKYKFLDANIIMERNELINNEKLHNELCNIMGNIWQKQSLTQPIVCATLSGNEKICSMIDNKIEVIGESPYWLLSKAQLKVNQQRDSIDLLLCDLVKALLENEDTMKVVEERKKTHEQNVNSKSLQNEFVPLNGLEEFIVFKKMLNENLEEFNKVATSLTTAADVKQPRAIRDMSLVVIPEESFAQSTYFWVNSWCKTLLYCFGGLMR